jgi:hypothetical protein
MSCVYALADESLPEDYRYIGRTGVAPNTRLSKHIYSAKKMNTHVYKWIRKVQDKNRKVIIIVLEDNLTFEESEAREIILIEKYKKEGYKLTNISSGGGGCVGRKDSPEVLEQKRLRAIGNKNMLGKKHTEETKAKLRGNKNSLGKSPSMETREKQRLAALNRGISPENREKMRLGRIGKKHSAEHKEKIRLANLGKKVSPETREKLRQAGMGHIVTEETREKLRQVKLGTTASPETRAKISRSQIGRTASPETRAKISVAHAGRKLSPERCTQMSEVSKRTWERKRAAEAKSKN